MLRVNWNHLPDFFSKDLSAQQCVVFIAFTVSLFRFQPICFQKAGVLKGQLQALAENTSRQKKQSILFGERYRVSARVKTQAAVYTYILLYLLIIYRYNDIDI